MVRSMFFRSSIYMTLLTLFCCFGGTNLFACDACGGGTCSNGFGMLSAYRNNVVGLGTGMSSYESAIEYDGTSEAYFYTTEFYCQYYVNDRIKLTLNQPLRRNVRMQEGEKSVLQGLADTRIAVNYLVLREAKIGQKMKLFLEAGVGLKTPIGRYNANLFDNNLPENFNIGNGSWGMILQQNAVLIWAIIMA